MIPVVGAYIGVTIWYHLDYDTLCDPGSFICLCGYLGSSLEGIYPPCGWWLTGLLVFKLFAITIGSTLGGILGMLVSVPVAATPLSDC